MPLDMPSDRFVRLKDSELTSAELTRLIRERLASRGAAGEADIDLPKYGATGVPPDPPGDRPYNFSLYHHLHLLNGRYAALDTEPNLAPSPATRVPLLGSLWKLIRRQMHTLVLFYVNRLGEHQTDINQYLVQVVNGLTAENDALAQRVSALEARLAALEDSTPDPQ